MDPHELQPGCNVACGSAAPVEPLHFIIAQAARAQRRLGSSFWRLGLTTTTTTTTTSLQHTELRELPTRPTRFFFTTESIATTKRSDSLTDLGRNHTTSPAPPFRNHVFRARTR